jgi:hypothetical protein
MSKPNLSEGARAARREREERHRRQLRSHRITSWLMFILLAGSNIYHVIENQSLKEGWRTDQAPTGHPYYVVTRGYIGHDKQWRSFDTGQPIEVTHWTTKTVKK